MNELREAEEIPPIVNPASREHVISELKSDFRFSLFYLLAHIRPGVHWRELGREARLPEAMAEDFATQLFAAGLWKLRDDRIVVEQDLIDMGDLKISEFLSMSVSLLARVHADGPCWYETMFIVTNERLKKEFYRKVNQAMKELVEASGKPGDEMILAWNHSGLDCLKALREEDL